MIEIEKHIENYAGKAGQFSAAQLEEYLRSLQCEIPTASLYYHLSRLIGQKRLSRMTRGVYSASAAKPEFRAIVTDEMRGTFASLHKSLPFASFCLYMGTELSPFQHNMAANNILYVETQKDTCDSAFNILKEAGRKVYLRPDKEMINRYANLADPAVFIKPLTSESPVFKGKDGITTPSLEKLLVDINVDEDFFYLQGEEAFLIFRNAMERYGINEGRLLRYARRRCLETTIRKYMEDSKI